MKQYAEEIFGIVPFTPSCLTTPFSGWAPGLAATTSGLVLWGVVLVT